MTPRLEQFKFTAIAGVPLPDFLADHAEKLVATLADGPDGTLDEAIERIAVEHPELTKVELSQCDVRMLLALVIAHTGQYGPVMMMPRPS